MQRALWGFSFNFSFNFSFLYFLFTRHFSFFCSNQLCGGGLFLILPTLFVFFLLNDLGCLNSPQICLMLSLPFTLELLRSLFNRRYWNTWRHIRSNSFNLNLGFDLYLSFDLNLGFNLNLSFDLGFDIYLSFDLRFFYNNPLLAHFNLNRT